MEESESHQFLRVACSPIEPTLVEDGDMRDGFTSTKARRVNCCR